VNDVVGVEVGDVEDADGNGLGMTCLEGDRLKDGGEPGLAAGLGGAPEDAFR
jgi:hypothetical protein